MKRILILGAGNRILGDDGIGSIVAERLQYLSNDCIEIVDAGTSLYSYLWPLLFDENTPDEIIIMDVIVGNAPGAIHFIHFTDINKIFFSSHLFPDSNFLNEISKRNVNIELLLCELGKYDKIFSDKISENGEICINNMENFIKNYLKSIK